ncbi:unnamed protein product [[Candida] boidinii]|nr:unnamed protein product [[Candida] boidinii]
MGNRIAFHFQNSKESIENLKKTILESYLDSLENPYTQRGAVRLYRSDSNASSKTVVADSNHSTSSHSASISSVSSSKPVFNVAVHAHPLQI